MKVIFLLLYFFTAYLTYYKACKHKANSYLWLILGLLLPYFSLLAAQLYFRRKAVINACPSKTLPGYRSRTTWKMVTASIFYAAFILFVSASIFFGNTNTGTIEQKGRNNSSAAVQTKPKTGEPIAVAPNKPAGTAVSNKPADVKTDSKLLVEPKATEKKSGGQLKVHFINVGQADSILIQTPAGKNMLIDAGNNADGNMVVNYLKAQGVKQIDVLVGTHPHEDHIGGMDTVVMNFSVKKLYMPRVSTTTRTFTDLLKAVNARGLKVSAAAGGMTIELDPNVKAEILAPNGISYEDLNDYSAVIKLTYNNTSFLLAGDAGDQSEQEILARSFDVKADVLKVSHHGSSSATTQKFLDKVKPSCAVIMVGSYNDYGHPHKEIMDRLKKQGITVYRTDENGTIVASSDGNTIKFNTSPGDYKCGILKQSYNTPDESVGSTADRPPVSNSSGSAHTQTRTADNTDTKPVTAGVGEKQYVDANGNGLIKGNISSKSEKVYHLPGGAYYDRTNAEAWFKTESEAQAAGFRRSSR